VSNARFAALLWIRDKIEKEPAAMFDCYEMFFMFVFDNIARIAPADRICNSIARIAAEIVAENLTDERVLFMRDIFAYIGAGALRFNEGDRLLLNSIVRWLAKLPRAEESRAVIHAAIRVLVANRSTLSSVNARCLEDAFLTQSAGNRDDSLLFGIAVLMSGGETRAFAPTFTIRHGRSL
jgi:hypothetical protein